VFYIGIDLGTTNCSLCYIDSSSLGNNVHKKVKCLAINQFVSLNSQQSFFSLPSFIYIAHSSIRYTGHFAREQQVFSPSRVVASAKSWLSTPNLDRTAKILPWFFSDESIEETEKISPVEALSIFLATLKKAWEEFGGLPEFNEQNIVITVPASFGPVPQKLVILAAQLANFDIGKVSLIEEPLAAFISLIENKKLSSKLKVASSKYKNILVCDVGGGTTDFSTFLLKSDNDIERLAVSEHLLLGGDNLDLFLSHYILDKFKLNLTAKQFLALISQVRALKEEVLSNSDDYLASIQIVSDSSDIFAESISFDVKSSEVRFALINSFFECCSLTTTLNQARSGLREIGLSYATDTRITVHLAKFLRDHFYLIDQEKYIDAVIFVGGTLTPQVFRDKILDCLEIWQGVRPKELENPDFQMCVAKGAALYCFQKFNLKSHAEILSVKSGYPYSILIESEGDLVCILPKGSEAGFTYKVSNEFILTLGETFCLPIYLSPLVIPQGLNKKSKAELRLLDSSHQLKTVIKCKLKERGQSVIANLSLVLNATGLLFFNLADLGSNRSWDLDFNLKQFKNNSLKTANYTSFTEDKLLKINNLILFYWGKPSKDIEKGVLPKRILYELEKIAGSPLNTWTASMLRSIWIPLYNGITRRNRSPEHEMFFFRLAGMALRPGYGYSLDENRIDELWKLLDLGISYPKNKLVLTQWFIMWRRVVGGLDSQKQQTLYNIYESSIFKDSEALKMVVSFERVSLGEKKRTIDLILKHIYRSKKIDKNFEWSLKRLLLRVPLYSSDGSVIDANYMREIYHTFLKQDLPEATYVSLLKVFCQSSQFVNNPLVDIDHRMREDLILRANKQRFPYHIVVNLKKIGIPSEDEKSELFGDNLPIGMNFV
jgi:molecular chaperone DnaK (HSP70)